MPTLTDILNYTDKDIGQMDVSTIMQLRHLAQQGALQKLISESQNQSLQNMLSKHDHRAFAREYVTEKPWMALPMAAATPAYQLAKLLGIASGRSEPSMSQMGYGLLGVGEGLLGALKRH